MCSDDEEEEDDVVDTVLLATSTETMEQLTEVGQLTDDLACKLCASLACLLAVLRFKPPHLACMLDPTSESCLAAALARLLQQPGRAGEAGASQAQHWFLRQLGHSSCS